MRQYKFSTIIAILGGILIFSPVLFLFFELLSSGSLSRIDEILSSKREITLLKRSVSIAFGSALLSTLVSTLLAFFITKTDLPLKRIFQKIYLIPFLIPPYLQAILWVTIFNPNFFKKVNPQLDVFSDWGAMFIYFCSLFPLSTLIISTGLKSIDKDKEEVAVLNTKKRFVLRDITLPLIYPHIMVSFFVIFVLALTNFEVADTLRLPVYPLEIFINFSAFYDEQMATLLALPLIGITLIMLSIISVKMRGKSFSMLENGNNKTYIYNLGALKYFVTGGITIFFITVVLLPLILLFLKVPKLSLYLDYLIKCKDEFIRTWLVSFIASIVITCFSYAICRLIVRSKGWLRNLFDILTLLPLGIPSIIIGISLIKLWNRPYLDVVYSSPVILIIGSLATLSPFIIRVMYPSVHRIDKGLEEACSFSQRSFIQKFLKVELPLALPGLLTGIIISFILYIGNIGVALLITPPGEGTIPISIYNYMHYGSQEAVFALSLLLILIVAITMLPLYLLKKALEGKK